MQKSRSQQREESARRVRALMEEEASRRRIAIRELFDRAHQAGAGSVSTFYRWYKGNSVPTIANLNRFRDALARDNGSQGAPLVPSEEDFFAEGRQPELADHEGGLPAIGRNLTPNQATKVVGTRALELEGYLPGDIILYDMSIEPRPGDIVVAQHYLPSGDAETVLRLFQPPNLVARSMDRSIEPIHIAPRYVKIMATVISSTRMRRD